MPVADMNQAAVPTQEAQAPAQPAPQVKGRRTQLKIVRESIDSLSRDVGSFRRSHEASIKKLEKQVSVLRGELEASAVTKDLGNFRKSHDINSKRLEQQMASLRNELAALKSGIAKDAARSRAKEEALMSRILAKLSPKPKKPTKSAKKR